MSGDTILVVDDDFDIRDTISKFLTSRNYNVITLADGSEAIETARSRNVDLVILDLKLPDINGLELASKLKSNSDINVIILSGLSETFEKIIGLEVGADDYVTKPFDMHELLARIHSVLRSKKSKMKGANKSFAGETGSNIIYYFDGWSLNAATRDLITPDGEYISLSTNEFNLLKVFIEHPRDVLSRSQIIELTDDSYEPSFERAIDNRVMHLRRKLNQASVSIDFIKTVHNVGYTFTPSVSYS